jgi:streptomycin 6-kinase
VSDVVPASLVTLLRGRPAEGYLSGDDWLDRLPGLVHESLSRWDLTPDGKAMHGVCALVLPVRRTTGEAAVLKVGWPHPEARHEHLALQLWGGRGAVRLLAADPASWAMLLERLDPDRDLHAVPVDEACAVIGGLLRQLDRPATPQLASLTGAVDRLVAALASPPPGIPRRFVEQALSLAPDLVRDGRADARMVHTDLHYANVLAGQRQPWLAIDPKPLAAEPAFAVAPALWNRWEEAVAGHDVRGALRRRLAVICEHGGIDEDRARAWTIVREVQNALEAGSGREAAARVTVAVAILKAMNE